MLEYMDADCRDDGGSKTNYVSIRWEVANVDGNTGIASDSI